MSEAKEYLKRVGLIQSPYISQERVIKHLEAFAKEQVDSQQRELLKRFIDYINYLQATAEDILYTDIDVFLKRFNCG